MKKKYPKSHKLLKDSPFKLYSAEFSSDRGVLYHFFDSHGIYGFVYMGEGRWLWEIRKLKDDSTVDWHDVLLSELAWIPEERNAAELDLFENLFKTLEKR